MIKEKINSKCRVNYIDILKGIGIIFMLCQHNGMVNKNYAKYYQAFYMPLFFWVSGYLYKNYKANIQSFIKNKTRSLLVPYISFALFHYFIWIIIFGINSNKDLIKPLKCVFFNTTDKSFPIAGALWFLPCLYFVEIFFILISRVFFM